MASVSRDPLSDFYPPPTPGVAPEVPAIEVEIPGRGFSVTGLVFASLGLITLVGAIVGVLFGMWGQRKGDPLARWAIILSAMSMPGFFALIGMLEAAGIE